MQYDKASVVLFLVTLGIALLMVALQENVINSGDTFLSYSGGVLNSWQLNDIALLLSDLHKTIIKQKLEKLCTTQLKYNLINGGISGRR